MKEDIKKIVEIPEGVEVVINNLEIVIKSNGKELKREFDLPNITIEKTKDLEISAKKATKRESKLIGTSVAHLKNMIKGVQEDFIYNLEICNVHFPMTVKIETDKIVIKNFLGERVDRISKIYKNAKVEINGHQVVVSSHDKEAAGQTAANLEKATRVKGRDRRIFQDGIFITNKAGKKI